MAIQVMYCEVEITYNEYRNQWEFELRGRSRSCDSLMAAKSAIDAPTPQSKKKPFARFSAYMEDRWEHGFRPVEVTSVAGKSSYRDSYKVWIVDSKGNRAKVSTDSIYAITPDNDAKIAKINRLKAEAKTLNEQEGAVRKSLTGIVELLGAATEV
jgi:hypothetical protein